MYLGLSKVIPLQNTPPFTNASFLNYLFSKNIGKYQYTDQVYEDQVDTFGLAVRFTCAEDP